MEKPHVIPSGEIVRLSNYRMGDLPAISISTPTSCILAFQADALWALTPKRPVGLAALSLFSPHPKSVSSKMPWRLKARSAIFAHADQWSKIAKRRWWDNEEG
jgi:hypothetical protein